MKKVYLLCSLAIFFGIAAGISYFLIRDAHSAIPGNITLTNQDGQPYTFGKDKSKLKLIEFIYTHCPDVCPTTTQKMVSLKQKLEEKGVFGKNIEFVTITIDPYRDTPEILTRYMKGFGIEKGNHWVFLTGDKNNIKADLKKLNKLTDALQFQYKDPGNGQFVHTTFTYLVDENNQFITKFPMGKDFDEQAVYNTIIEKIK
ncbi:SCO family protein [Bacillus rubiinfantis]|uniref:SCO family protein n=1 Tax=Bacillus rubiinfantis TaxID=1499680 RepID=UPI0005A98086|nr:SCO family protein [Bacillus rubiinfantis]